MTGGEPVDLAVSLDGWDRRSGPHPVRMGVPLARGRFRNSAGLTLFEDDVPAACDLEVMARWSDGSLKWILLRFQALSRGDGGPRTYRLSPGNGDAIARNDGTLVLSHTQDALLVDTGAASFTIDKHWLYPIRQARVGEMDLLGHTGVPVLAEDAEGKPLRFRIDSLEIEFAGNTQADIFAAGDLVDDGGKAFCRGECRLFFFAGTALVKIEFALWNPKPAVHASGLWDLGDPGSVRFRACRLAFPFPADTAAGNGRRIRASLDPDATPSVDGGQGPFSVHQSSSGNDTWRSASLVDRDNRPTPLFRGFRAGGAGSPLEGKRANPALVLISGSGPAIALAMEDFWQTFPNRLSADAGGLVAEPFPLGESEFELQGGEMAPSAIWLDFDAPEDPAAALACARKPVTPRLDPSAYGDSGCFPYLAPGVTGPDPFWSGLARDFLDGGNGIFARQERFEEFGWRNYGEFPADHEKEHYRGSREFVSHYNNQYDFLQSCLYQFAGTGDARWFRLAAGLGSHVMHVDLYRTEGDKNAYNGGYFWHTAHYLNAGTGTHRCYSRLAADGEALPPGFGGGPSNEHNYTTGLLLYHYLTGDRRARRCVSQLAGWVEGMQDGSRTPFRFLSSNPTGLATATRELSYQGPGRGAGNSINACLDAASLTGERRWLDLAESLMRSCLGPGDDPEELGLLDRENRWSYLVFLQILGKFLDVKRERNELDSGFHHARACLLKLADWMAEKEYPYLDKPQELEYPTSTWAAQDLRKMCVFLFAAKYAPPEKEAMFLARAERFLASSKAYLGAAPDKDSVRNMALMLVTLPMQGAAARAASWNLGLQEGPRSEVRGERPVPQKLQAMARAKRIVATLGLAALPIAFKVLLERRSAARRNRRPGP